jgi:hypothetical protein
MPVAVTGAMTVPALEICGQSVGVRPSKYARHASSTARGLSTHLRNCSSTSPWFTPKSAVISESRSPAKPNPFACEVLASGLVAVRKLAHHGR